MRYIMAVVEQLDRAARELRADHPVSHRLALILTDNAVELVIHQRCTHHAEWDRILLKPKLTPKQRRDALGRYFEDKLNVLKALGELSEPERRYILVCHDYRNELYHVGLGHQQIIEALAGSYFRFACGLFARLEPAHIAWHPDVPLTDLARTYLQATGSDEFALADVKKLGPYMLGQAPVPPSLHETLSDAAEAAVEEVEDMFSYVARDNPSRMDAEEAFREIQFSHEFGRRLDAAGIIAKHYEPGSAERSSEIHKQLRAEWEPPFKRLPFDRWRGRARALRRQPDELRVLADYQALRDEMEPLEAGINEAASGLDQYFDMQLDMMRGK
jgi:hypothetical protein